MVLGQDSNSLYRLSRDAKAFYIIKGKRVKTSGALIWGRSAAQAIHENGGSRGVSG
jgi:hypothetical protein